MDAMKARQAISGAVFDHSTLAAIGTAFDEAWDTVKHLHTSADHENARFTLASRILQLAPNFVGDVEGLKQAAVGDLYGPAPRPKG
jgi:hypothetical protein